LEKPERCESIHLKSKPVILPIELRESIENQLDGGQETSEILEMIALPQQDKILKNLKADDYKTRRYFQNRCIIVISKDGRLAYYKLMGVSSEGIADIVDIVKT
jgi:hypothetical protein